MSYVRQEWGLPIMSTVFFVLGLFQFLIILIFDYGRDYFLAPEYNILPDAMIRRAIVMSGLFVAAGITGLGYTITQYFLLQDTKRKLPNKTRFLKFIEISAIVFFIMGLFYMYRSLPIIRRVPSESTKTVMAIFSSAFFVVASLLMVATVIGHLIPVEDG